MPSTESLESRATLPLRRGSRSVTSANAAPLGVKTRSRACAQQECCLIGKGQQECDPGATAAPPGVTTRSRARAQQESQSARAKLDGAGKADGCRKKAKLDGAGEADGCRKRAKLDGTSQRVSSPEKGKNIPEHSLDYGWGEEEEEEDDYGWGEEEEDDYGWTSSSSAVSSPIRVPVPMSYIDQGPTGDSETVKAYRDKNLAFRQKLGRQMKLPTLFADVPPDCLFNDPTLLHIREPARKTVLRAAQFVVGVSSSIEGQPLARFSGFWIDFDNENRTGTVVTTALVIRTKHTMQDVWFCKDQYDCDAKVNVHLRGYINAEGYLLYYQKHYNLAFFRVTVDPSVQLPSFSDKVKCAQDIFELGRDENFDLLINHGRVEFSNPTGKERYHHMYIQGPERDSMYDIGGPVIDLDGKVVGMIGSCSRGSFIPSSILLKCFHLWRNFQRIPRPHLGLRFNAISLLNPAHAERISIVCGIDEGLIVDEVSENTPAEKCGIRIGDVIECINGKSISTTVELENTLLSIMENIGDNLNSDLDLEIQVYCTRRDVRKIKVLTVNVSDDGEYCAPYYTTPPRRHRVT